MSSNLTTRTILRYNLKSSRCTDLALVEAVKQATSYAGVLRVLGFSQAGGTQTYLKTRVVALGLDTSHFTGQGWLKDKTHSHYHSQPIQEMLIVNNNKNSRCRKSVV